MIVGKFESDGTLDSVNLYGMVHGMIGSESEWAVVYHLKGNLRRASGKLVSLSSEFWPWPQRAVLSLSPE